MWQLWEVLHIIYNTPKAFSKLFRFEERGLLIARRQSFQRRRYASQIDHINLVDFPMRLAYKTT